MSEQQWCVVRGCVALADGRHEPFLCRTHEAMTKAERRQWSDEHSFNLPVLVPVDDGRIVYQRPDGSRYRIGVGGEQIEDV